MARASTAPRARPASSSSSILPRALRYGFRLGASGFIEGEFWIRARESVIDGELCRHLGAMAGFRNVAVHDYETLDVAILERIVAGRLCELDAFWAAATRQLTMASAPQG